MSLKCIGKTALLFLYFLILKKQYNSKAKTQCMWVGTQDAKETQSV